MLRDGRQSNGFNSRRKFSVEVSAMKSSGKLGRSSWRSYRGLPALLNAKHSGKRRGPGSLTLVFAHSSFTICRKTYEELKGRWKGVEAVYNSPEIIEVRQNLVHRAFRSHPLIYSSLFLNDLLLRSATELTWTAAGLTGLILSSPARKRPRPRQLPYRRM